MSESEDHSEDAADAVDHLNAALSAEEESEMKFHVRQALQLLTVE